MIYSRSLYQIYGITCVLQSLPGRALSHLARIYAGQSSDSSLSLTILIIREIDIWGCFGLNIYIYRHLPRSRLGVR